ncbi:MAG: biotin transporter BioY [Alphaproteobacteria bacterium]|nr:biotin transporter BioY [Alphaproteobacteria bacterium]
MKTRDIVYISLFAALVAVLGMLPAIYLAAIPAPITAQTLGVMLAGGILGAKRGGLSLLLFLLLVAIGLPVLSGGRGGIAMFVGPTAGFMISFPVAAFVVGYLTEKMWDKYNFAYALLFNFIGGILVVYLIGIPWLAVVANMTLAKAFAVGCVSYLPGGVIKVFIASAIAVSVKKAYPVIQIEKQPKIKTAET